MQPEQYRKTGRTAPAALTVDPEGALSRHASGQGADGPSPAEARISQAQAWISIGVGLAGLFAPRVAARMSGMPYWPTLLRIRGAREVASGLGMIAQPQSPAWRWARVAGDAMDGAVMGAALFSTGAQRRRLAASMAVVGALVALDLHAVAGRARSS